MKLLSTARVEILILSLISLGTLEQVIYLQQSPKNNGDDNRTSLLRLSNEESVMLYLE